MSYQPIYMVEFLDPLNGEVDIGIIPPNDAEARNRMETLWANALAGDDSAIDRCGAVIRMSTHSLSASRLDRVATAIRRTAQVEGGEETVHSCAGAYVKDNPEWLDGVREYLQSDPCIRRPVPRPLRDLYSFNNINIERVLAGAVGQTTTAWHEACMKKTMLVPDEVAGTAQALAFRTAAVTILHLGLLPETREERDNPFTNLSTGHHRCLYDALCYKGGVVAFDEHLDVGVFSEEIKRG